MWLINRHLDVNHITNTRDWTFPNQLTHKPTRKMPSRRLCGETEVLGRPQTTGLPYSCCGWGASLVPE